jgi:hypothetical protein
MTFVDPVASLAARCQHCHPIVDHAPSRDRSDRLATRSTILPMGRTTLAPNRDQRERVAMRSAVLPRENAAPGNPIHKGNDRWPNAAS